MGKRSPAMANSFRLLNSVQQLCWFHGKRTRKLHEIDQSKISFAALNAADVISMEICFLGQFFLR